VTTSSWPSWIAYNPPLGVVNGHVLTMVYGLLLSIIHNWLIWQDNVGADLHDVFGSDLTGATRKVNS